MITVAHLARILFVVGVLVTSLTASALAQNSQFTNSPQLQTPPAFNPRMASVPPLNSAGSGQPQEQLAPQADPPSVAGAAQEDGKAPSRNLLQMFHEGGLMMYPLALCSFVLTVFVFERLLYLRGGRVIPRPFVRRLIEMLEQQQVDREEAIELCQKNPSPIAEIISSAVKRYGRPAVDVEQAVVDAGQRATQGLRKHLRLFSSLSNLCPLLGLLGTVLGMIRAFDEIAGANAMGRPDLLAGGISEALLTTASGLFVAIPAYIAFMYFSGRVDRLLTQMDGYAQQVVDIISAEGLAELESNRPRSRAKKAA